MQCINGQRVHRGCIGNTISIHYALCKLSLEVELHNVAGNIAMCINNLITMYTITINGPVRLIVIYIQSDS